MNRILLAFLLFAPLPLLAQDTTNCSQLGIDLDGDLQIGAGDILMLLGGYGTDLDLDGDMIPDCQDDCVGAYDTCGVCNGPGPQVLAIDTIIIVYDSIYVDTINEWLTYVLTEDTLFHLVCENPGCTDPLAENYDPYAEEGGNCDYSGSTCGDPLSFQGYTYNTIQIGNQCWFAENLRYLPSIGLPSDNEGIPNATICGENYSLEADPFSSTYQTFGALYNFSAVQEWELCPSGWHIPSDSDWMQMESSLGMPENELISYDDSRGYAAGIHLALKDSLEVWQIPGNNSSGFSALPGGTSYSSNDDCFFLPEASNDQGWALFGTNTVENGGFIIRILTDSGSIGIPRFGVSSVSLGGDYDQYVSIRCVQD